MLLLEPPAPYTYLYPCPLHLPLPLPVPLQLKSEVISAGVQQLVLDTRDLTIHAVHIYSSPDADSAPQPVQYSLDEAQQVSAMRTMV